jgi:hypothetical protein
LLFSLIRPKKIDVSGYPTDPKFLLPTLKILLIEKTAKHFKKVVIGRAVIALKQQKSKMKGKRKG